MKQNVFIERINMETQTVFHEDGKINIYPCGFELGQHICSGWDMVSQKGRMVTEDDGTSHFRPYRQDSGSRYKMLVSTCYTDVKRTRERLIVRMSLPLKLKPTQLAQVVLIEAAMIAQWLKVNCNSLRKRKK